MFSFLRRKSTRQKSYQHSSYFTKHEPDDLEKTATQIALDLIEDHGEELYIEGMKRVFRMTPELIQDVAPEYREKLKHVLDQEQ